jgi:hypothetical protein
LKGKEAEQREKEVILGEEKKDENEQDLDDQNRNDPVEDKHTENQEETRDCIGIKCQLNILQTKPKRIKLVAKNKKCQDCSNTESAILRK